MQHNYIDNVHVILVCINDENSDTGVKIPESSIFSFVIVCSGALGT